MPKLNDLSRSLVTLEQDATLIAVIEQHRKATTEGRSLALKTAVPLSDSDLLVPPPEPNCELDAPDPRRLDYERQCYRAAEVFARSRLLLLQTSVDKTVEALRNREQTNP